MDCWLVRSLKFCAVICRDRVDYYKAEVLSFDSDWDLITEDMVLRFEIGCLNA